ncbi:MAG: hypothetical protein SWY16_06465 [Cyanobacteriota bacterium]|nr:hypothetical protein [Cyanobacteriota bacterium]
MVSFQPSAFSRQLSESVFPIESDRWHPKEYSELGNGELGEKREKGGRRGKEMTLRTRGRGEGEMGKLGESECTH